MDLTAVLLTAADRGLQHDAVRDRKLACFQPVKHIELRGLECGEESERAGVDADQSDRRCALPDSFIKDPARCTQDRAVAADRDDEIRTVKDSFRGQESDMFRIGKQFPERFCHADLRAEQMQPFADAQGGLQRRFFGKIGINHTNHCGTLFT